MHADAAVECYREYTRVVLEGLADELGPEQTTRALEALAFSPPDDVE